MKAKTQKIVSLVLAAAMAFSSLTYTAVAAPAVDDSVNADLGSATYKVSESAAFPGEDKGTIAKGTKLFEDANVSIVAIDALTQSGSSAIRRGSDSTYTTKFSDEAGLIVDGSKFRKSIGITPAVSGTFTLRGINLADSKTGGTNYMYVFTCDPAIMEDGGAVTVEHKEQSVLSKQDVTFNVKANTTYYVASRGATIDLTEFVLTSDSISGGSQQPTDPPKEIVPEESPYYTGDTYQLLDTYEVDSTIAKDVLLHKDKFEFSLSSGGVVCLDTEVGVKAIQDNKSCPTFGDSYMKSYKIHALEDGKITVEYAPLGTKTLALGEAATGDDSANVTLVGDPINPTQEQVKKLQTLVINAKKGTYYYFGGKSTAPQIVSVKYEADGGSVTPPPTPTSGTINFTAEVSDEDNTVEKDGKFTVDIYVEASEATPVNNADFIFNFNKDVAKVVSAKRLKNGADLGAEPEEDLENYLIDQAGHVDNTNSPFHGMNDLVGSPLYESGIVPISFFLNVGTVITTTRQKVATLELQAIAKGTVDPKIEVKDCMSAPKEDEAQKDWTDKTANPDVTVDTPAIDNVEVTENQVTPPTPTDPNSLVIDPQNSNIDSAKPENVTVKIVLDNVKTPVNNGTFWIFYNGNAEHKNGTDAGKGTQYVIADSLKVINLTGTACDTNIPIDWEIKDANLVNGEEYVSGDKTPADAGKLKAAFRIQKNATEDSNQIEAGDLIPDVGQDKADIAEVVFKLKDGAPDIAADDEIKIPITLKVVDFAGIPEKDENGAISYPDIPTNDKFEGYITIKGKNATQTTSSSTTSTTSTTTTTTSSSTTTTKEPQPQQPTNPPTNTTEAPGETTTAGAVTPGGSSGGGGGGGGSAHRSTTTAATTEAVTEAASSGEVDTGEAPPDEEKPAGAVAEFLNAEGYHFAYMVGYPDGSFGPNRNVTRGEIAAVFARLITGDINVGSNSASYSDIAGNEWYADYIGYLEDLDIIAGYTDGTFGPNRPITRAEFAALLSKFTGSASASDATFTDVAGHWAAAQIAAAVKAGWMSGYPDKTFKPNAYITRAELVSAINRATGRTPDVTAASGVTFTDVPNGAWYANDVAEAVTEHWYTGKEKWYLSEDEYNAAVAPSEEEVSEETTEAASEAVSGETTTAEEESTKEGETSDGTTEAVTEAAAESTTKEDSTEPSA